MRFPLSFVAGEKQQFVSFYFYQRMAKAQPKAGYIAQMIDIRKTNIENDFKEVFAQFQI